MSFSLARILFKVEEAIVGLDFLARFLVYLSEFYTIWPNYMLNYPHLELLKALAVSFCGWVSSVTLFASRERERESMVITSEGSHTSKMNTTLLSLSSTKLIRSWMLKVTTAKILKAMISISLINNNINACYYSPSQSSYTNLIDERQIH